MGRSTFISAALHVAILLLALVAFPASKMGSSPLVAIPVDLATTGDVTRIKAGMESAKDAAPLAAKLKEPKPQAVKEKSSSEPPPEEIAAQEPKKREEKPKPKQTAEKPKEAPATAKTKVEKPEREKVKQAEAERPKPRKAVAKKRDIETDKIAALLNKIPDAADESTPRETAEETKPGRGQKSGTELRMSVNEIDALRARIADCWNPPPGGLGADSIVVKLRLELNEDGTLVGYPSVANSGASPFFQAAADSAVRAVYQCQPYSLPKAKYALWRDMILNFDPSDMYRSG
jgi:outer membrane biosynthesis protein TonB